MSRLQRELDRLATLSSADLRLEWQRCYEEQAPLLSPALLRMGIAYRLQEKRLGAMSAALERRIAAKTRPSKAAVTLSPGSELVRSWNGRTLTVQVTGDGFLFEQRRYRSLSAIAREVTGTAWSGPRFFGLQERVRG